MVSQQVETYLGQPIYWDGTTNIFSSGSFSSRDPQELFAMLDAASTVTSLPRAAISPSAGLPGYDPPPTMELAGVSQLNIWEMLDVLLPEELLGLDITPGVQVGKETKGRVYYDNVWVEDGKVKTIRKGEPRTLGYTPRFAKKKYRTKRRRKRLTKRDMYILEVMKSSPSAGALALML